MLIDDGLVQHIGDPGRSAALPAAELRTGQSEDHEATHEGSGEVRLLDAWMRTPPSPPDQRRTRGKVRLRVELEAMRDLPGLAAGFSLANADGIGIFDFGVTVTRVTARRARRRKSASRSAPGREPPQPGRYFVHLGVKRATRRVPLHQQRYRVRVFGATRTRADRLPPPRDRAVVESGRNERAVEPVDRAARGAWALCPRRWANGAFSICSG